MSLVHCGGPDLRKRSKLREHNFVKMASDFSFQIPANKATHRTDNQRQSLDFEFFYNAHLVLSRTMEYVRSYLRISTATQLWRAPADFIRVDSAARVCACLELSNLVDVVQICSLFSGD